MPAATVSDLAPLPLFGGLDESELGELASRFEVRSVGPGVRLVAEGASGYSFFVVAEGSAVVSADEREVATLGPGDFFGEFALLGDGRRWATVTTVSPARVLVLFGTEFRRLQQEHPAIAAQIEAAMRKRSAALG